MKWNFYFILCASFLFIYSMNCQSIENVDGNLKFLIAEGKRIGIVSTHVLHIVLLPLLCTAITISFNIIFNVTLIHCITLGYKYGNETVVYFDTLSTTDTTLGLSLQTMYSLGNH